MACTYCQEVISRARPRATEVCKCKDAIHLDCLMVKMLAIALKKSTNSYKVYDIENMKCDGCQQPLPQKILLNKKEINLLRIMKDVDATSIVLGQLRRNKSGYSKLIILDPNQSEFSFSLGSDIKNEIYIKSPFISPRHLLIYWKKPTLYIKDQKSRYGTWLKISGKINLLDINGRHIMYKNFLMHFQNIESKSFLR